MARTASPQPKARIKFRRRFVTATPSPSEIAAAERVLARLIARAFARDHPHLFTPPGAALAEHETSGPPAAAAAVAGAPPANAGGPEQRSRENERTTNLPAAK
jgi:hypothetical protein